MCDMAGGAGGAGADMNVGGVPLDQALSQEEMTIIDANGDGIISQQELEQFESLVDTDGNGEISAQELENFREFIDENQIASNDELVKAIDDILHSMGIDQSANPLREPEACESGESCGKTAAAGGGGENRAQVKESQVFINSDGDLEVMEVIGADKAQGQAAA